MPLIEIANSTEVLALINQVATSYKSEGIIPRVVCFTNANAWYIDTLVANLLASAAQFEPTCKLAVFCSDEAGVEKCRALGFPHFARVDIPLLDVSTTTENTDSSTIAYTRLSFVKVALCKFILDQSMIPLYWDPDMSLKKSGTISDLLSHLIWCDFVCAGNEAYMNSNILIATPRQKMRDFFTLTTDDVEEVINHSQKFGDEDFFRPKLSPLSYSDAVRDTKPFFECVPRSEYPAGCDVLYFDQARMIHANCVSGLSNKIKLLQSANAWYLPLNCADLSLKFFSHASVRYPHFLEEQGKLFEEYFYKYVYDKQPYLARRYINATWTNLYCNAQFRGEPYDAAQLQRELDALPFRARGYFAVVQFDEGVKYQTLPPDTLVFGCCTGDVPIPLVYESSIFAAAPPKSWEDKGTFCSFIGSITHPVRERMACFLDTFEWMYPTDYFISYSSDQYDLFIEKTRDSKFCLAPRGFGRSSFRFYEALKLGSIPVYIWDDVAWLPFADKVDYDRLCVVLHVSRLSELDGILRAIDREKYNQMRTYYESVKHLFEYDGMCEEIIARLHLP